MSDTRKIIDYTFDENAVGMRDALYAAIHDRVTAHIEDKKQEIARGLIVQHAEDVDIDPEDAEEFEDESGDEDLEEAFPGADYKSQIPTKPGEKAGFTSKRISTGTVYSRKPVKDEPATPSKKK
jgi:hypothetical protein